ncbi:MAG TPA: hypothetical protein VFH21_08380, partial [Burkholderiales bacterium]|nr:hypothetical protein [Burkholderiales bacterium]
MRDIDRRLVRIETMAEIAKSQAPAESACQENSAGREQARKPERSNIRSSGSPGPEHHRHAANQSHTNKISA